MNPDKRSRVWQRLGESAERPRIQQWLDEARSVRPERTSPVARRLSVFMLAHRGSLATICAIAVAAAFWVAMQPRSTTALYETQAGERLSVELSDHSRVTLNAKTTIAVHFTRNTRDIDLRQGEAMFNVAHDSARPFRVSALGVTARSLGTEYDVDVRRAGVTVAVIEGAVLVSTSPQRSTSVSIEPALSRVAAGHALRVPRTGLATAEAADAQRISSWTHGEIEFIDAPLSEVVEDINRYSPKEVTIGSSALAGMRVGGLFRTDDPSGYLLMLRQTLGIDLREQNGSIVLTENRKNSSQ